MPSRPIVAWRTERWKAAGRVGRIVEIGEKIGETSGRRARLGAHNQRQFGVADGRKPVLLLQHPMIRQDRSIGQNAHPSPAPLNRA